MGINYYVQIKPEKKKLQEALDAEDWRGLRRALPDEIHIGKSSVGWEFLFNHNDGDYYKRTRKSIADFIAANSLWNEYGELVQPSQFWELVDAKKGGRHSLNDLTHDKLRFSSHTCFS